MSRSPVDLGGIAPLFDRRAPEALVTELGPGGRFQDFVRLALASARGESALDLHLRANPKEKHAEQGRATLYMGVTKAFDLKTKRGKFRIAPQENFAAHLVEFARERGWTSFQEPEELASGWDEVMSWADEVIKDGSSGKAKGKVSGEGVFQAALSSSGSSEYCLIDRESIPVYASDRDRKAAREALRSQLEPARKFLRRTEGAWADRKVPFGNKLDGLGVDSRGRVLLVEVKPGSETGPLGWTPMQIATYHAMFRTWGSANPVKARGVLEGMIQQRRKVGLLSGDWRIAEPLEFVPVIAVGMPVASSKVVNERMPKVRDAISAVDPSLLADLEIWTVPGAPGRVEIGQL